MITAASVLWVLVWGIIQWPAHSSSGLCSAVSSLSGGLSSFSARGFSGDFACGATSVSTRYCGLQASGAPTWVAAAAANWRRALVLVSRGEGGWLEGEGVVVLICQVNGVASLGVAVWSLDLGVLDG